MMYNYQNELFMRTLTTLLFLLLFRLKNGIMGKRLLFCVICVCSLFNLIAQESVLSDRLKNDVLKVRQIPMSEEVVKAYFKGMKGIVYATIYPAANCPRCEAAIMDLYKGIKNLSKENQTVLITAYKDSIEAKAYNQAKGYKADNYIYDTEKKYRDFLSFSFGNLHVVYMLKIDVDRGLVLLGFSADDTTPEFISEYVNSKELMKCEDFKPIKSPYTYNRIEPKNCDTLHVGEIHTMKIPQEINVSEVLFKPYYEGNNIVFNEKLRNSILLLELDENTSTLHFKKEITSDSVENKKYINVPQWYYNHQKKNGNLYHIALSPVIANDKIVVSYSLPNLFVVKETDGEVEAIGYKNEPCVIFRDINGDKDRDVFSLIETNENYHTNHFTFGVSDSILVMPCVKQTWAMNFEKEKYQDIPSMNPFDSRFYDDNNPLFRAVDSKTGLTKEYFGDLDEIHRKTLTGYYFTSPVFDSYKGKAVYTDGLSGMIHLVKTDKLNETVRTFNAFSVDLDILPEPDSTKFYTKDYLLTYLEPLSRKIYDMRLGCCGKLYCILQYGINKGDLGDLTFTYVEIDIKNGDTHEYVLPKHDDALKYGLWRKDGVVKPYMICRDRVVVFGQNK